MFSLNKPYLGVGLGSRRLGVGLWPDRIRVESRDGEVGQASGQDVAWQTTPVPTHTLFNFPYIHFLSFHLMVFWATHPSSLASIRLTHSPSGCLPPASVCTIMPAPGHKEYEDDSDPASWAATLVRTQ